MEAKNEVTTVNTKNNVSNTIHVTKSRKPLAKKAKKNKIITKIGTTGTRIAKALGLIVTVFTIWGIIKTYTTKNIAGKWKLKFVVEKCNHVVYIGESHTQITVFSQIDKAIEGNGEKWDYNGKQLPFDMHRKIEYKGTVDGSEFKAIYVLHGRDRDSEGHISVTISPDGKTLKGTYSGTIGNDSGPVTGERID
jgi:hypothetical protein